MDSNESAPLSDEQMTQVVKQTIEEITDAYEQTINIACLWERAANEHQVSNFHCFADGLQAAKQLFEEAVKTATKKDQNLDKTRKDKQL